MSESNETKQIQELAEQDLAVQHDLNSRPASSTQVKLRIDPLELLRQVEQMRKDGVDEATIRAAFNEVMDKVEGRPRQARSSMKRHIGSVPMPTQAEINKMYEARYKGIDDKDTMSDSVRTILETIEETKARKALIPPPPPLRVRIATYLVRKVLAATILFCRLLGVK